MKFLLIAMLTLGMLPGGPELVVEGDGPECVATARGDVETFLILYYDHDDPDGSGSPFSYTGPVRLLPSGTASVAYDWSPVAIQWYGKPVGASRFRLKGGCGSVPPKNISRDPKNTTPLEKCTYFMTEPMELYARAYYLHADPDDPYKRYSYKSEVTMYKETRVVRMDLALPTGVAWYYRQCASLAVFPSGDWTLAKTCGTIPASIPVKRFQSLEEAQLFASK